MSFLVGALSGALVASGVYYVAFSYDLQTRTLRHRKDLRLLVNNLQEPQVPAPPTAASRIPHDPRKTLLAQRWNDEIEGLFVAFTRLDRKVTEWGRRIIGDRG